MNRLDDLNQFTGSDNYYRNKNYPFFYTDGIKYLAEGGAYWLLDAIASWQEDPIIKNDQDLNQIQFWKLKVDSSSAGILVCERDQDDPVITQKIPYTEFPLPEITLFLCDMGTQGILILPSEY